MVARLCNFLNGKQKHFGDDAPKKVNTI